MYDAFISLVLNAISIVKKEGWRLRYGIYRKCRLETVHVSMFREHLV